MVFVLYSWVFMWIEEKQTLAKSWTAFDCMPLLSNGCDLGMSSLAQDESPLTFECVCARARVALQWLPPLAHALHRWYFQRTLTACVMRFAGSYHCLQITIMVYSFIAANRIENPLKTRAFVSFHFVLDKLLYAIFIREKWLFYCYQCGGGKKKDEDFERVRRGIGHRTKAKRRKCIRQINCNEFGVCECAAKWGKTVNAQ